MKKYLNILKNCSLFSGVADENLIPLLGCLNARVKGFAKKETIFSEGDAAEYIGIVLSGSVQIAVVDFLGNRNIISFAETGELFGESFACADIKSLPISIIANEASEIMMVDCRRILYSCSNACDFHRQIIFNLMKTLAVKNIVFHQKQEVTSKRTTREKIIAYLMQQAKKTGRRCFDIPFDRQELADYLEVDRSGLSAELSKLQKEGILTYRKNHFELILGCKDGLLNTVSH